jgi:hypothetical protein
MLQGYFSSPETAIDAWPFGVWEAHGDEWRNWNGKRLDNWDECGEITPVIVTDTLRHWRLGD